VIVPAYSPFYRPFLDGIEDAAGDHPAVLLVGSDREDPRRGLQYLDRLLARGIDGIIIVVADIIPEREAHSRHRAFPAMMFADWPGGPGPAVDLDLEAATFQRARHLLEHGHTRIGHIAMARSLSNQAPRYAGYEKALRGAGLEPDPHLLAVTPDFQVSSGRAAAEQLLRVPQPPTAIVAAGDGLAVGAYQAARRLGARVPEDLAVVGGDGTPDVVLDPPLTTTALSAKEMGIQAMHMLRQLMAGRSPRPRRRTLQPDLVIGQSCGCPQ